MRQPGPLPLVLLLGALVLLAGCNAVPIGAQEVGGSVAANDSLAANASVTDPGTDRQGWERGFWYDESLAITTADGLNDSELDAVVARAMARVEHVRGVEFERPVPVELVTRSEYRNSTMSGAGASSGDGSASATQQAAAAEQAAQFEALFLVGEAGDAGQQQSENRGSTVQGYYDTRQDRIVIVSKNDPPRPNEVTLAQELYHAYQFRQVLASTPVPRNMNDDQVRGVLSLVEGDANFVDRLYEQQCEASWECLRDEDARQAGDEGGEGAASTGDDSTPSIHMGLYLLSYFPYAEGEELIQDTYAESGWEGVDRLYEAPPLSSAQVIEQDLDSDSSLVQAPDRSSAAWERVDSGPPGRTVGEAGIATMFAYTIYDDRNASLVSRDDFLNTGPDGSVNSTNPLDYGLPESDGWAGDTLYTYRNGDQTGYVWHTTWETRGDARQFADAYERLLGYHDAEQVDENTFLILEGPFADAFRVTVDGKRVTIVNGPAPSTLSGIHDGAANATA
ncbi:Hvo_1808 family surface protein [Haloarchaeobius amylolyticus]|uniref:Hvo_1808 family surface protein n=1 Tax=Haloarchaeobius amylolyticus TaxID=1198296 RepID=UPI00226F45FE|nr:Hvo_1808 family surface protein [Haloarchaeobius amylolyticus]